MNITSVLSRRARRAFTILELLVSMTVLALLLVLVSRIVGDVQRAWQQSSAKVYQFREARRAFDQLKTEMSQATLNAYMRYYYNNNSNVFLPYNITVGNQQATNTSAQVEYLPLGFTLFSELQFLTVPCSYIFPNVNGNGQVAATGHAVFFQAPLGQTLTTNSMVTTIYGSSAGSYSSPTGMLSPSLPSAMNGRGYFVMFGSDQPWRPPFISPDRIPYKYRYRLMEFCPTAEYNNIYGDNVTIQNFNPYAYVASQCSSSSPPPPGGVLSMNTSNWILMATGGTMPNYLQWSRPAADNVVALILSPQVPVAKGSTALPTDIAPQYYYNSSAYAISSTTGNLPLPAWAFQLPPEVQVTMIVIDEVSAEALANANLPAGGGSPTPPLSFLSGTNLFNNASSYANDMLTVQQQLSQVQPKLNWRIFTANVIMRNARWNGTPTS